MNLKSNITRYLCISTVATLTLTSVFSWWLASDSIDTYRASRRRIVQLNDFNKVLTVSNDLASERAYANELIMSSKERKKIAWLNLLQSRRVTDTDIAQVPHKFLTTGLLRDTKSKLADARMAVDRYRNDEVTQPDIAQGAMDKMLVATNVFHQGLFRKTSEFIRLAPSELGPLLRAQALGEIRDVAGRLGSVLLIPLQTKTPIPTSHLITLTRSIERINLQWWLLETHGDEIADHTQFQNLLARARNKFQVQGVDLINQLASQSVHGDPYSVDAESFAIKYHASIGLFNELMDVYLTEVKDHYLYLEKDAVNNLIKVSGILLLLYMLIIGAVVYVHKRVLEPILHLNSVTNAILAGDKQAVALLATNSAIEVRELWASLGMLGHKLNEQTEKSEILKKSSEEDPMTTLLNRRGFEKFAGGIVLKADKFTPVWVILIDIDHFKKINDTWGHPAGDAVLVNFAAMLKRVCRKGDIVARIGGEEFVVVFSHSDEKAALRCAARIMEETRLLETVISDEQTLRITASFGVTSGHHKSLASLLAEADLELYNAKNSGRDRISYQSVKECA